MRTGKPINTISSPPNDSDWPDIFSTSWNKYRYWHEFSLERDSIQEKKSFSGFHSDRCCQKRNRVRTVKKMAAAYSWPDLTTTYFLTLLFAIISGRLKAVRSTGQSVGLILGDPLLNSANMIFIYCGLESEVLGGQVFFFFSWRISIFLTLTKRKICRNHFKNNF